MLATKPTIHSVRVGSLDDTQLYTCPGSSAADGAMTAAQLLRRYRHQLVDVLQPAETLTRRSSSGSMQLDNFNNSCGRRCCCQLSTLELNCRSSNVDSVVRLAASTTYTPIDVQLDDA